MHLFVLAALLQPEPQITLDLPATRLPEIAKRISEQTGERVKITGPDPSQFIFIKVEKMPFSRLRESLSFVTGGKWSRVGEVWTLQTVPEDYFAELDYRKRLQAWLNSTKRLPGLTEGLSSRQLQTLAFLNRNDAELGLEDVKDGVSYNRTPVHRLMTQTLQPLSADLLSLKDGTRRVYALRPTALQKPLPTQFPQVFQGFLAERATLAKHDPGDAGTEDGGESALPESSPPVDVSHTAAAHLELSKMDGSLTVRLNLFDRKGRLIGQSELLPLQEPLPTAQIDDPLLKDQPLLPESLLCEIPPEEEAFAVEFRKLTLSRDGLPGQKAAMTPATKSVLEGQVNRDLLSMNPSSLLSQATRALGRQLVAKLNDWALEDGLKRTLSGETLSNRFRAITGFSDVGSGTMKVESDLICSRPSPMMGGFALSGNGRDTAIKAMREEAAGLPRLEVLSQIALDQARGRNLYLPALTSGFFTHQGSLIPFEGEIALLRIYGLLTEDEKKQAKNGGLELVLSRLRPDQQGAVWRLLLDCAETFPAEAEAPGRALSDLDKEPTVYLAGVSDDAIRLRIKLSYQPTSLVRTANGRGLEVDPTTVAMVLYRLERNIQPKIPATTFSGTLGTLEMKTFVGSRVMVTHTYSQHQSSPNPIERPFSDLPPEMMKQAEEIVREWRNQRLNAPPPVVKPPVAASR